MARRFQAFAFSAIPHQLLDEATDPYIPTVYAWAARHGSHSDGCWCSIQTLASETKVGHNVVRRSLHWLEEHGWIEAIRRPGETTLWRIRLEPLGERPPTPPGSSRGPLPDQGGDPSRIREGTPTGSSRGPLPDPVDKQEPKNKNPRTRKTPLTPQPLPAAANDPAPPAPVARADDALVSAFPRQPAQPDLTGSVQPEKPGVTTAAAAPQEGGSGSLAVARQPEASKGALLAPSEAKPRNKHFRPAAADVPLDLQPLAEELMVFWGVKKGTRTVEAWNLLLGNIRRIRDDRRGGIEVARTQLESAIQAGWRSVTYGNWEKYAANSRSAEQHSHLQHLNGARPTRSDVAVANVMRAIETGQMW